jgi:hypothetical protein
MSLCHLTPMKNREGGSSFSLIAHSPFRLLFVSTLTTVPHQTFSSMPSSLATSGQASPCPSLAFLLHFAPHTVSLAYLSLFLLSIPIHARFISASSLLAPFFFL